VLLFGLARQPHLGVVELEQEEERENEEAAEDGDEHQPAKHAERELIAFLVGDRVHGCQLGNAGEYLSDDGPKGNLKGLGIDGFMCELRQREEQRIAKIIEESRYMQGKGIAQRLAVEADIECCAEQHDREAGAGASEQAREGLQPKQEQQEDR